LLIYLFQLLNINFLIILFFLLWFYFFLIKSLVFIFILFFLIFFFLLLLLIFFFLLLFIIFVIIINLFFKLIIDFCLMWTSFRFFFNNILHIELLKMLLSISEFFFEKLWMLFASCLKYLHLMMMLSILVFVLRFFKLRNPKLLKLSRSQIIWSRFISFIIIIWVWRIWAKNLISRVIFIYWESLVLLRIIQWLSERCLFMVIFTIIEFILIIRTSTISILAVLILRNFNTSTWSTSFIGWCAAII